MRSRLMLGPIIALALALAACSTSDDTASQPTATTAAAPVSSAVPTPTPQPTVDGTTEPTQATTVEPPPTPVGLAPGWTGFTVADGLPAEDVWVIDVNADGTVWAMVALSRTSDGDPDEVAFARYDAGAWTSFPTPEPLDGPLALASGPAGTAWVVGAGEYVGFRGVEYGGTPGVWYFDGTAWEQIQAEPRLGDPWPIRAEAGPDGVLWSVGITDTATSRTGLLRHDTDSWSTLPFPDHVWDCVACQTAFVAPDNSVWLSYEGIIADESVGQLARLEGDTWQAPQIVSYDVFDLIETTAGLTFSARAGMGTDGIYFLLGTAGITQSRPGLPLPGPGDDIHYAFETFDGEEWKPILRGTLRIGAGHTLEPGDVTAQTTGGPKSLVAAHHNGTVYLAGLGGLHLLDGTGLAASYSARDGLVSDTTQHVATGPNGTVWIATNAGISALVPEA